MRGAPASTREAMAVSRRTREQVRDELARAAAALARAGFDAWEWLLGGSSAGRPATDPTPAPPPSSLDRADIERLARKKGLIP